MPISEQCVFQCMSIYGTTIIFIALEWFNNHCDMPFNQCHIKEHSHFNSDFVIRCVVYLQGLENGIRKITLQYVEVINQKYLTP